VVVALAEDDGGKPTIRLRIAKDFDTSRNLDKWFLENVTPKDHRESGSAGSNSQSRVRIYAV